MTAIIKVAIVCLVAYFIGNISPSTILARRQGLDIKKEGSGNAGTTNALRVMGKKAGAITFVVDILKGVVAVLIGTLVAGQLGAVACALSVFIGHVWPVIYKFKGGKGVATAFGAMLAINPLMALIEFAIVLIVVLITKRMSCGSIIGAAACPFAAYFMEPQFVWAGALIAIILIMKHSANINRIIHGEEPKMSIFDKNSKSSGKEGR